MNIIRMIVGNCHVGLSDRKLIRYVISRLKDKDATFWAMSKDNRRYFMTTCLKEHRENQQLYRDVMSGNL